MSIIIKLCLNYHYFQYNWSKCKYSCHLRTNMVTYSFFFFLWSTHVLADMLTIIFKIRCFVSYVMDILKFGHASKGILNIAAIWGMISLNSTAIWGMISDCLVNAMLIEITLCLDLCRTRFTYFLGNERKLEIDKIFWWVIGQMAKLIEHILARKHFSTLMTDC